MRFATLGIEGRLQPAMVSPDGLGFCLLNTLLPGFTGDLIAARHAVPPATQWTSMQDHAVLTLIPQPPRNVFCVGKNYHEHAREFADSGYDTSAAKGEMAPEFPVIFTKLPSGIGFKPPRFLKAGDVVESASTIWAR